jgi:hypothetical protein
MEPSHKELLIGLIGSTYGELKRLDDSIIGSSNTLTRRSDQVKQELANVLKGNAFKPDVPILQAITTPQAIPTNPLPQPVVAPAPQVVEVPPQVIQPAPEKIDDGQLLFDLDRKTKYEDIIVEIDRIYTKVGKLEDKIDELIKIVKDQKKKVG